MREMLEPIFGESGAVVAQFLITLAVVLLLVGLVYWLVRQFTGARLHGAGRGRGPRLAIIDALSIDSRRKLVLIRRDHIEHLILIGGPSDLVVEPSIVRGVPAGSRPRQGQPQRPPQPQQNVATPQPQPQANQAHAQVPATPQPRRDEPTGISEPIPFPQPRRTQMRQVSAEVGAPTTESAQNSATAADPMPQRRPQPVPVTTGSTATLAARGEPASAHFEETSHPSQIESVFSLADALDEIADGSVSESEAPEMNDEPAPAITIDDESESESGNPQAEEPEAATNVGDLEEEMARLLGQITSKRDS
jgi:flagellar protein FliO/FliZ